MCLSAINQTKSWNETRIKGGESEEARLTQILVFPSGTGGREFGIDTGKNFEIRPIFDSFYLIDCLVD